MKQNITFNRLDNNDQIAFELLLLGDPSKYLLDEYLKKSEIFTLSRKDETLAVPVLLPLTAGTVEIKNIAVKSAFQGKGLGSYLIEKVIQIAILNNKKSICIGTANSSIGQLYLYQKLGFEITDIIKFFFTSNYAEPIFENGIQAKHMVVLTKQLVNKKG